MLHSIRSHLSRTSPPTRRAIIYTPTFTANPTPRVWTRMCVTHSPLRCRSNLQYRSNLQHQAADNVDQADDISARQEREVCCEKPEPKTPAGNYRKARKHHPRGRFPAGSLCLARPCPGGRRLRPELEHSG